MSNCDTITLRIPQHPGIGVPVIGDWREFAWPEPGEQVVRCAVCDLVWCVWCALSQERRGELMEVLNETETQ